MFNKKHKNGNIILKVIYFGLGKRNTVFVLGDFAVLVASGLSIKQALSMNFTSSLAAFLGGIVGCAIGGQWNATFWIFSITAGLFTYIALADMVSSLCH